jgi:ATP-dependent protease HslVU (ClpYQ) peptidase subunit
VCGNEQAMHIIKRIPFDEKAPTIKHVDEWCAIAKTYFKDKEFRFDILIMGNNSIFSLNEDLFPIEDTNKFQAIGSGRDLAIGALYALKETKILPSEKVRIAVEAARAYNSYVGGTIHTAII